MRHHRGLHRELEVAYCRLAHWPFLSDAGRIAQKDLDIAEYTDPVNNPMIPHVIVLERRGSKAARSSSVTAKRTSKLSANRIRIGIASGDMLRAVAWV